MFRAILVAAALLGSVQAGYSQEEESEEEDTWPAPELLALLKSTMKNCVPMIKERYNFTEADSYGRLKREVSILPSWPERLNAFYVQGTTRVILDQIEDLSYENQTSVYQSPFGDRYNGYPYVQTWHVYIQEITYDSYGNVENRRGNAHIIDCVFEMFDDHKIIGVEIAR